MFENVVTKANDIGGIKEAVNYTSQINFYVYGAEDN